jgi:hypothetical protein
MLHTTALGAVGFSECLRVTTKTNTNPDQTKHPFPSQNTTLLSLDSPSNTHESPARHNTSVHELPRLQVSD